MGLLADDTDVKCWSLRWLWKRKRKENILPPNHITEYPQDKTSQEKGYKKNSWEPHEYQIIKA